MSASDPARRPGVRFALDTSCLVALLADWHQHHRETVRAYEERIERGERLVVAGHAFLECFSVLTRLPPPLAATPQTAEEVLSKYLDRAEIAGMTPEACRSAVHSLAGRGIGGGRVYDAIIALCSYQAGATTLLTWNPRHFLAVSPSGLSLMEP